MRTLLKRHAWLGLFFVLLCGPALAQQAPSVPFAQRQIKFENGTIGKPLSFESANPRNFEEIVARGTLRPIKLDGQLFVPSAAQKPHSVVILVPGSGGVSPDHLKHAQELTSAGLPVFILDPFAGRGIKNTVADQGQLSRAASVYDVLAAAKMLATHPGIDAGRIAALGYSRGGMAVLLAAAHPLTRAVLGPGKHLKAVLAGWPACAYQFENDLTAPTTIRFLVGDSDNWVSPLQCQGQAAAMRAKNPHVSFRFFKDAYHGFGYYGPLRDIPNAVKSYNAPITYIDDRGSFLDWYTGQPMPGAGDSDIEHLRAPWTERGAKVGSKPGQTEAFISDMVRFFKEELKE